MMVEKNKYCKNCGKEIVNKYYYLDEDLLDKEKVFCSINCLFRNMLKTGKIKEITVKDYCKDDLSAICKSCNKEYFASDNELRKNKKLIVDRNGNEFCNADCCIDYYINTDEIILGRIQENVIPIQVISTGRLTGAFYLLQKIYKYILKKVYKKY